MLEIDPPGSVRLKLRLLRFNSRAPKRRSMFMTCLLVMAVDNSALRRRHEGASFYDLTKHLHAQSVSMSGQMPECRRQRLPQKIDLTIPLRIPP